MLDNIDSTDTNFHHFPSLFIYPFHPFLILPFTFFHIVSLPFTFFHFRWTSFHLLSPPSHFLSPPPTTFEFPSSITFKNFLSLSSNTFAIPFASSHYFCTSFHLILPLSHFISAPFSSFNLLSPYHPINLNILNQGYEAKVPQKIAQYRFLLDQCSVRHISQYT